ncbi:MAG: 4Fe-4S binding protein [Paraprevotella sp.]|nr:4Fe-4S binding protein [Paraprevotella sp.]
MLRKIRLTLAVVCFVLITLLFLDFTGTMHAWFGWLARVQFLPALLAMNAAVVVALVVLTLLFGRVYCSVICPLGVMQDIFGRMGKRAKKNRYSYSPAKQVLRGIMLAVAVVAFVLGLNSVVALLAPYSAYGRIAQNLLSPLWLWGNNLLADLAERADSYAFYSVDVWVRSGVTFAIALLTLLIIGVLAWRNGRTYCNTICPVGTVLGCLAKYSLLKPVIDTTKCNSCGLCARNCKAACIDIKNHRIDYTRCVDCMDCIDKCHKGAISYARGAKAPVADAGKKEKTDASRRQFLAVTAMAAATSAVKAQKKKVDGGLAVIEDKKVPERVTPIVPPGALSLRNMASHCTACQLCVSACPNDVLRPSTKLATLMQPELSYERGYCRPECTKCSEVCPAGAILKITPEDKSATQIGHAVWVKKNCIPLTDGVDCGNCARHCPTGAIQMVLSDADNPDSPKIPVVNTARCIGCGACENLCPARPFSAIYVEGYTVHNTY